MDINELKGKSESEIRKIVRGVIKESYSSKEDLDEISWAGLKGAGKLAIDKTKEKGKEVVNKAKEVGKEYQTAYRQGDLTAKLDKAGEEFQKFLRKDLNPILDKINKRQKQLGKKEVSLKSMLTTMANKYGK